MALDTTVADRERVARNSRRRIGSDICAVDQRWLARGQRVGAESVGAGAGLARAHVYAGAVVVAAGRRGLVCADAAEFAACGRGLQYAEPVVVRCVAELDRIQRRTVGTALCADGRAVGSAARRA